MDKLLLPILLLLVSPYANAHGEEALFALGAQLLSVVICLFTVLLVKSIKPYRFVATVIIIFSVIGAEYVMYDIPFNDHRLAITLVSVLLPWAVLVIVALVGRALAKSQP